MTEPTTFGFAWSPKYYNHDGTYLSAYANSCTRRLFGPAILDGCFVVSYYKHGELEERKAYASVYDAIREINIIKHDNSIGTKLILSYYTDKEFLCPIKTWEYVMKGGFNAVGSYHIESEEWTSKKHYVNQEPIEMTLDLTQKELRTLQSMLELYVDLQEEVYGPIEDNTTVFTQTQLNLFKRLKIS